MATAPKFSRATLDAVNNTIAIRNGLVWDYYPVSFRPYEAGNFIEFDLRPPVVTDGIVTVKKTQYGVTKAQVLRGIVDVRNIRIEERSANQDTTKSGSKRSTSKSTSSPVPVSDESTALADSDDEISQAADMAFNDQVSTLLSSLSEEAGDYEVTDTP